MPELADIAEQARIRKGITKLKWVELAGVHRSQLRLFEKGGNLKRETIDKLLAPLGIVMLYTSSADLAETRRQLESVEHLLATLQTSMETITKILQPLGLSLTVLTEAEVAGAHKNIREVQRYLASIEIQSAHTERRQT